MPSLPASWKKYVSLECPKPQSMLHGPKPRRFQSQNFVDPSVRYGRVWIRVLALTLRSARAPVPVTSLYVEPGG
jgi:hypothetical protein